MADSIVVAILSLIGTAIGSVVSVLTANRLTNFKIEMLQKELTELKDETKKHNQVIERTFKLEERAAVVDEQIKVANHRIADLESSTVKRGV